MSLSGVRDGRWFEKLGAPGLGVVGARVVYRYAGVRAWYVGRSSGLEQGFTVARSTHSGSAGELSLVLALGAGRFVRVSSDREQAIILDRRGEVVARYGALSTLDARGRLLRSWLTGSGQQLLIHVSIAGAAYPLRIDPLIQTGSLSGAAGDVLGTVAVSGSNLFATSSVSDGQSPNAVSVFSKPTSGWDQGSVVAELKASDGTGSDGFGSTLAVSGQTLAALAPDAGSSPGSQAQPPGAVYLFSEPAGGWSGTVYQSAKLVSSDPACPSLDNVAISGSIVAATCYTDARTAYSPSQPILVFTEPAGGWTGTLTQSAALVASPGQSIIDAAVAISGSTIFTGAISADLKQSYALAFGKPAGGWSGTVAPSGTLTVDSQGQIVSAAASGNTVFLGGPSDTSPFNDGTAVVLAYQEPGHGWTGTIHPAARLDYFSGSPGVSGPDLAVTASSLALSHTDTYDGEGDQDHGCPCDSTLDVFHRPEGGWSGTLVPQSTADFIGSDGAAVTAEGNTVFAGSGDPTVRIFDATQPASPQTGLEVSGIKTSAPRITAHAFAGSDSHQITTITVKLPAGLRFTTNHRQLNRGISITAQHTVSLSKGQLTLRLTHARSEVRLTIRKPAIKERNGLQRAARRATKRRPLRIKTRLTAVDTAGDTTNRLFTSSLK